MTAGRKVNFHGPDGHGPTMHTVAAAPPETQRALGPFGGADLIEGGAGALRLLTGQLFAVAHAGKIGHQPGGITADVGVIGHVHRKAFLPAEHPGGIAGGRLVKAENEVDGGHEIRREYVELNADPQHEGDAEDAAQDYARLFPGQQQAGGGQVGETIDDEQGDAGKGQILEYYLREGQHLEVGQHAIHPHGFSGGVQEHHGSAAHGADADKKRPKNEDAPGCFVS